jgi:hypothetical protein
VKCKLEKLSAYKRPAGRWLVEEHHRGVTA